MLVLVRLGRGSRPRLTEHGCLNFSQYHTTRYWRRGVERTKEQQLASESRVAAFKECWSREEVECRDWPALQ